MLEHIWTEFNFKRTLAALEGVYIAEIATGKHIGGD